MARFRRKSEKNASALKAFYEAPNPEIDIIVEGLKESVKSQPKNMTADDEIAYILKQENIEDYFDLIDWKQRRYELAKAAMQAIISNPVTFKMMRKSRVIGTNEMIALNATEVADEMIKHLKIKQL